MFSKFRNSISIISKLTTLYFLFVLSQRTVFRKVLFLALLMYTSIAGAQAQNIPGFTGRYLVTDLGAFGPNLGVHSINASGQIVGQWYVTDSVGNRTGYCFRTAPYSPINPATDYLNPPGTYCQASAINDLGQVAGLMGMYPTRAYRTAPNSAINPNTDFLEGTSGITESGATGINNLGQVIGGALMPNGDWTGFRTGPNATINPTTDSFGIHNAVPYGINDSGVAVGYIVPQAPSFENPYVAFRTTPNNEPIALSSLGSYGGYYTIGLDINNSGQIVGWSGIPQSNDLRPYILEPNQLLNPLPIAPPNSPYVTFGNVVSGHGSFYSINSFGTAVGNFNNNYAVAYSNGAFSFLNEKLIGGSGWGLVWATAINDSGHIVGVGFFNGATHGFLLTPYIDGVPPVLNVPSNISVAAESSFGTVISYPTSAIDDFFNPASISCNHSSGSLFPIGSTIVSCTATDGAGNTSAPRTFTVEVVDTAPNLSLPPYISTNASSASGATVTYFASADDAVSGQLPATCSPASGVTFPIGQTTVNCSASDGAGNTSTGSFNVYVLTGDQIFTPPDWYVTLQPNNGPTINMYVDSPGVTTIQPIDAATVGTTPAGFALSNGIAYQISTTAGVYFDYGVELIFAVPGPISETDFNNLRILHNNNGTLEDVTSGYGYDPATQSGNIHAYTYSFSPFYLAKKVDRKVSPLFNQTHAFKAGSTAPIKIQILNETGGNISSAATVLMARNLVRLGSNSASVVIDSGNSNPDLNFRYDNSLRGYIFNLKTTGLAAGKYALSFYAGSDRAFFHTVEFEVR